MAAVRWEATLPLLRSGCGENSENNKVEFGAAQRSRSVRTRLSSWQPPRAWGFL